MPMPVDRRGLISVYDNVSESEPEDCLKAARVVASYAEDKEDAKELLAMLGLLPEKKESSE